MAIRRCLGIDLGGAASATTGLVLLEGDGERPSVSGGLRPQCLAKPRHPVDAELRLRELIRDSGADIVAIDAPLNLPPCLSCSSNCQGPGESDCEDWAARLMWQEGANPTSQRRCEQLVAGRFGQRPLATMQLGVITARAIALVRDLAREGKYSVVDHTLMEVYPRATRLALAESDPRLGRRQPGPSETKTEAGKADRALALAVLEGMIGGIAEWRAELEEGHTFDGLIAAYTAWLGPQRCLAPPDGWDLARDGWIWFPDSDPFRDRAAQLRLAYARPPEA